MLECNYYANSLNKHVVLTYGFRVGTNQYYRVVRLIVNLKGKKNSIQNDFKNPQVFIVYGCLCLNSPFIIDIASIL